MCEYDKYAFFIAFVGNVAEACLLLMKTLKFTCFFVVDIVGSFHEDMLLAQKILILTLTSKYHYFVKSTEVEGRLRRSRGTASTWGKLGKHGLRREARLESVDRDVVGPGPNLKHEGLLVALVDAEGAVVERL